MHWKDLVPSFVCPECKSPLALREAAGKDELKCSGCKRVYPVEDDIPILLVDRARIEA
jgi:uncharacterized protein YbaR (Trm112 family)